MVRGNKRYVPCETRKSPKSCIQSCTRDLSSPRQFMNRTFWRGFHGNWLMPGRQGVQRTPASARMPSLSPERHHQSGFAPTLRITANTGFSVIFRNRFHLHPRPQRRLSLRPSGCQFTQVRWHVEEVRQRGHAHMRQVTVRSSHVQSFGQKRRNEVMWIWFWIIQEEYDRINYDSIQGSQCNILC